MLVILLLPVAVVLLLLLLLLLRIPFECRVKERLQPYLKLKLRDTYECFITWLQADGLTENQGMPSMHTMLEQDTFIEWYLRDDKISLRVCCNF